jgi:DNA replication protein DnaC
MITNPTLDRLQALKLNGMFRAYHEQLESAQYDDLSFDERLAMLVDRESVEQDNRRLKTRLKRAQLRLDACVEDIDYRHPRGLDKSLMLELAGGRWLHQHHNCIITGPTGTGKSYLACALGNKACREGYATLYFRATRLFGELATARALGRYERMLKTLLRADLLILDDWGTSVLTADQRRDLFEITEDRYDRRSTLIATQLPTKHWHETIGDPTLADAILDRLIHNAYTINLKGESMRKKKKILTNPKRSDTKNPS